MRTSMNTVARLLLVVVTAVAGAAWLAAQPAGGDPGIDGFRFVEVASVSGGLEQLHRQGGDMSHATSAPAPYSPPGHAPARPHQVRRSGGHGDAEKGRAQRRLGGIPGDARRDRRLA